MSGASFLDKLLDGTAVEYVPMGQIISRVREKGKNNRDIKTVYSVSNTHGLVKAEDFRDNTIHSEDTSNYTIVRHGMFAYNPARLNIGSIASLKTDTAGLVSPMYVVFSVDNKVVDNRYLNFFIKSTYCKNKINSLTEEGARFRFDFDRWDLIDVPLPSIEVQVEIVRILDAFTGLIAELTAELTARTKQYKYYRDQLLSFEEGKVEWKTLGDEHFFEVGSGGTPSKSKREYWVDGNIPWLKSETCNNEPVYSASNFITELGLQKSSAKLLKSETTLIALVGATIFKTAFLEFQAATNQNIASIKSKCPEVINDKFVFYYLTNLYEVLKSEMRNYGMLNLRTLRQFKIPIPSPGEQKRIVTILEKFDTLTNSITDGLPREIELRQKQYEYYRDLLLSFPKREAVEA